MKIIRNNVFETNSSSTHSLIFLRKPYKLPKRHYKKNYLGRVLPVTMDYPNLKVEIRHFADNAEGYGENSDLTHVEYQASYLFTALHLLKEHHMYINEDAKNDEEILDNGRKIIEINKLLEKFHKLLLDLDLCPEYGKIVYKYDMYDYNYDGHYQEERKCHLIYELEDGYMEANDGTYFNSIDVFKHILKNKETLKKFLTEQSVKIRYRG